jgi:hypothetical protein
MKEPGRVVLCLERFDQAIRETSQATVQPFILLRMGVKFTQYY